MCVIARDNGKNCWLSFLEICLNYAYVRVCTADKFLKNISLVIKTFNNTEQRETSEIITY